MAWLRLLVEVSAGQAEAFTDALLEFGALSASIEQNRLGGEDEVEVFGEPGTPPPALWPHCLVEALVPLQADANALISSAASLAGVEPLPAYQSDILADQDWVRLTQGQFEPIPAAPGLWIVPSWHTPPDPSAINVRLDPGQAFGTGSHPTTQLCLAWLVRHSPKGQNVLDYGCGSGILAIVAKMLGASSATGVDLDPAAVETSRENALRNQTDARFFLPDALKAGEFDGIVANILAAPLIMLAPLLLGHLKTGGWLTLSGILERQADEVMAAYAPACRLEVDSRSDGWVCLSGTKA
jgi:ribosomal protein L11 methyltransferase